MKRILVIDAGLKPAWTTKAADEVTALLLATGQMECERVTLRDEQVSPCRGCAVCLERGEGSCRFREDAANAILDRMLGADGIVTVTPVYSLQVPVPLKILYDRLAYVFHRPRLFGKPSLAVAVQGVYGGKQVVKYVDSLMAFWGCTPVKGAVVSGGLYAKSALADAVLKKNKTALERAAARFSESVLDFREKSPSFFRLAIFRMTRSSMKYSDEALSADRAYYADRGWTESPYYTGVGMGPHKRAFGALVDAMMRRMMKGSGKPAAQ